MAYLFLDTVCIKIDWLGKSWVFMSTFSGSQRILYCLCRVSIAGSGWKCICFLCRLMEFRQICKITGGIRKGIVYLWLACNMRHFTDACRLLNIYGTFCNKMLRFQKKRETFSALCRSTFLYPSLCTNSVSKRRRRRILFTITDPT